LYNTSLNLYIFIYNSFASWSNIISVKSWVNFWIRTIQKWTYFSFWDLWLTTKINICILQYTVWWCDINMFLCGKIIGNLIFWFWYLYNWWPVLFDCFRWKEILWSQSIIFSSRLYCLWDSWWDSIVFNINFRWLYFLLSFIKIFFILFSYLHCYNYYNKYNWQQNNKFW